MDEKSKRLMNIIMRGLSACAGIFVLIGAIGFLVNAEDAIYKGIGENKLSAFFVFHDFMRFGCFAIFTISAFALLFETLTKSKTFKSSMAGALMSVFGFVSCFISSASGYFSSMENRDTVKAGIVISAVFAMVSAVYSFVSLIILFINRSSAASQARYYAQPSYPGQPVPQQQYGQSAVTPQNMPQQGFPQQQFPNQPFPQQNIPQQNFQQSPAQQNYTNQTGFPQSYQQQNNQNPFNQNNFNNQ